MRILITGSNGFSGRNLIRFLEIETNNILFTSDLVSEGEKKYTQIDLSRFEQVVGLIETVKPDQIYHLAGSATNHFEKDYLVNVLSTRNILQSVLDLKIKTRILLIGSAAEYGYITQGQNPVKEDYPLNPVSIYGLTKTYQSSLMKFYVQNYELDIVMARTFNLLGVGLSENLFIGRLFKQISDYKNGKIQKIILGNLNSKRDYIEIEEAVKMYYQVMNKGTSGDVYNVGSGQSILIKDLLDKILNENQLDFSVVEIKEFQTAGKFDIPEIYSDISKISRLA